ncbi:MAG: hypothetical protein IJW70_02630 [Clostridia bacterium]|nr:hypothetical protein [Clostridia bacterium]
MKKRILPILSLLLLCSMLLGTLAACKDKPQEGDDPIDTSTSEETTTTPEEEKEPVRESVLTGDYASLIENAKWLENGVNAYYTTANRNAYAITNQKMKLNYSFDPENPQLVTSLTTPGGKPYISDTMDVYVKMEDGSTYYASNSTTAGTANIYRFGYYYYDIHLADQNFIDTVKVTNKKDLGVAFLKKGHDMTEPQISNDILTTSVTNSVDPYIYGNVKFRTKDINTLSITLRTTHMSEVQLFLNIDNDGYTDKRWVRLPIINDGEWHTYDFTLNDLTVENYDGMITALRFDFVGTAGSQVDIKEVRISHVDTGNKPELYLDRTLHVYSDKMNHVVRICAAADTTGIAEIGQITELAVDTVDKLIVKDANGEHTSLDGVDWATAEYIAFDVKGVGVFGYILLKDASSGSMKVTSEDGKYKIVQYTTPANGTILAPIDSNENDFYMGQRIYTDLTHDFDGFLKAAYEERNPLAAENIVVDTEAAPYAAYAGYDAIRGAYKFTMEPVTSFNIPYYESWHKHYNLVFDITGDDRDRNVYVMTYAHGTCIENGVLLGDGDMLLPVSLEVCKNFGHENEEPLYDCGDDMYSETYFPMTLKKGETDHYSVLNLYQNWGNFPLKQISSIQFFAPYYHLSTGVSESNCIAPYYVYNKDMFTLPDHRAMSAPLWSEMENPANGKQPQHTNGGYHYFLQYVGEDDKHYMSDNTQNVINSYGPTYADIDMSYISDDGKIAVTYNHMEMPQTDENRTYYQISYEVLEDISFENFKRDFSFYSVRGFGDYAKLGYLDENNQPAIVNSVADKNAVYYKLGDNAPYFDMFKIVTGDTSDYVNVSFLIADASFVIGGEQADVDFMIKNESYSTYLTLDLEQVTFKKGDTFTINAIIMPWGSHLTDFNSAEPDKNVRDVRMNTLLDPLKLDVTVGENVSNFFLPQIKAANDTAEFTLSGGENNISLRVYGFSKLTVPKVYEKVNGEWVEYKLNSLGSPDDQGYEHYYDGYMVYYDGDGTFSYSFVVAMSDKARTFKVELDHDFKGWPEDPDPTSKQPEVPDVELPLMIYYTPEQLAACTKESSGFGEIKLSEDGSYLRLHGNGKSPEAYFTIFAGGNKGETGQYAAIRYRTTKTDSTQFVNVEFFSGTKGTAPSGNADFAYTPGIIEDGEWHVMIFDLAAFLPTAFVAESDGTYHAKYLRFDAFSKVMDPEIYMDIAWIGMDGSLEEILAECQDLETVQLATAYGQIENVPTK